ncbi:MAG: hypothetical protein U0359_26670 [Byssovorax sp.]
MDPIIDLAPGAEDNPVAVELCEHLRRNLREHPHKQADFRGLRGSVLMVAQDLGESLTLRFDHGRLTIHDGTVGIPAVTFCADLAALRSLADLPLTSLGRLPAFGPLARAGRSTSAELLRLFARGDLKVYGLVAHPRTVVFLLRIFSIHG